MNNPVSFQLAKLLKEKGFKNSTNLMYSSNGILTDKVYDFDDWCFAPTIAEVVMWLYEKYGIWIKNDVISINRVIKFYSSYYKINDGLTQLPVQLDGNFNSPTEAYEAAIKYVLEKMITDNSK